MANRQTRITFTDAERAFLNAQAGQPLDQPVSAATVLLALRQWAVWTLRDVDGLFLPRQRGANLRAVSPEKKHKTAKAIWAQRDDEARQRQGELMRAAKKAKRGFRSK